MRYKKNYEEEKEKAKPKKRFLARLGLLALSFIVLFGIYATGNNLRFKPIVPIYFGALLILLAAFIILNRGIDTKIPEYDMLPDEWDADRKNAYLAKEEKKKRIARLLLFFIIPLLLIFAVDIIYLGFFAGINK